jgi:hypothetical protein
VLNRLDAGRVATIVGRWLAEQEVGALGRLAVDGKVLRGSGRHDGKPLQLLSAVTPENLGLCGCWQVIAVERTSCDTTQPDAAPSSDIGLYATSLTLDQYNDTAVLQIIRDHWPAIENGTHYRRDVTLGDDACHTAHRQGAAVLASLRNLAIGVYELRRR